MKYDTVVFDMDGTLLNTLDDIADSVNAILRQYQYPEKSLEEVRLAVGNGARQLMRLVLPGGEENPKFEQILKEYGAYYQEHCQKKTRAYDGIPELLQALKDAGVKMAIVSNKGDGAVKELNRQYFAKNIETAVGEREGIRRKPEPDSVLEALRILDSQKERALYVGDSEVDYHTAKKGKLTCVLVSWGFRDREQLAALQPDYLIDDPEQLLDILQ
ncbi:MAG: HAD family hydrolase [Lachnospiraceae bacterium]|nr:HAD family hydrolase [Lachnospiraceae bacterium]